MHYGMNVDVDNTRIEFFAWLHNIYYIPEECKIHSIKKENIDIIFLLIHSPTYRWWSGYRRHEVSGTTRGYSESRVGLKFWHCQIFTLYAIKLYLYNPPMLREN